jgi:CheY-like chemotaxis protein
MKSGEGVRGATSADANAAPGELRDRLAEEQALRAETERVSRLKDEFLATLGHELRTPLNAILGWSRLIEAGKLAPQEAQRGGQAIARNVRALVQLVDDLVDMSAIVNGKIRMDPEETDLAEVVQAVLETMQATAQAKGVTLLKALQPTECLVFGDPHRLQQIVWNLLSNAVKFTPRGGSVTTTLVRANGDWEVVIEDTGIGVAPADLSLIFDRFYHNGKRDQPGLGLGLAIVKQLAELHGGRAWAHSAGAGHGAAFHVRLPRLAPREHRSGASPEPAAPGVDLQGVRVLVVDDEHDTLELSRQVLSGRRAIVVTAASVETALATLRTFVADVLVSDLAMPGRDGYELIRTVRSHRDARSLPAAALTAFARPEDAVRAQDAGFQIHLPKPVEPDELVRIVAQLAGRA